MVLGHSRAWGIPDLGENSQGDLLFGLGAAFLLIAWDYLAATKFFPDASRVGRGFVLPHETIYMLAHGERMPTRACMCVGMTPMRM